MTLLKKEMFIQPILFWVKAPSDNAIFQLTSSNRTVCVKLKENWKERSFFSSLICEFFPAKTPEILPKDLSSSCHGDENSEGQNFDPVQK